MTSVRQVFDSIAHCPNVNLCLRDDAAAHPCRKIVRSQDVPKPDFQLPEPWRGEIDRAAILFVGSNPSIGDDRYATRSSSEMDIWESQHLAFGGGNRPYIIDGIKTAKPDGSADRVVQYWSSIRARARELLPRAVAGKDYAITEVVHCKSIGETGVVEALRTCYDLHLKNVFSVSPAQVVLVLGTIARNALLGPELAAPAEPLEMELGDRKRTVLFLPHPNARGEKKSLEAHYSAAALESARRLLGEDPGAATR